MLESLHADSALAMFGAQDVSRQVVPAKTAASVLEAAAWTVQMGRSTPMRAEELADAVREARRSR